MAVKILLLEDDLSLQELISEYLQENGFEVTVCDNAKTALNLAYEKFFNLWIFDVKVPFLDGFSLLKELRAYKNTPSIFITSLNSTQDLKQGFDSGCDDYIKKPFELAELKIRILALLKRDFAHKNEEFEDLGNGYTFSFTNFMLYYQNKALNVPLKEIKLLGLFLKNKNKFLSHELIINELWDYEQNPSELALRVYIKNLRKILGKDRIKNQRGRGYCYV